MNKAYLILLSSMFILLFSVSVNAYTKGTANNYVNYELLIYDEYDTGIVYTPECISNCHLPIKFYYSGTSAPATREITRDDVKSILNKLDFNDDVKVDGIRYLRNISYNVTDVYNVTCSDSFNCTKGTTVITTKWRLEWKELTTTSVTLQKNKVYVIDIYGHRTPTLRQLKTDIIPEVLGVNMSELAWWNSSWSYCKNLTITRYASDVVAYNITGLRLTNSYEARIINNSCSGAGTEQNFTVKSSATASASDDWLDVEFKAPATNTTWSVYYGNAGAANPAYYFLLFNPNMASLSISATTDTAYDWHSDDTAKYSVTGGYLLAAHIDSAEYNTDQLQTQMDFSSYGKVTVWVKSYMTSASGNEYYTRFFAATATLGSWANTWSNFQLTSANKYRMYKDNAPTDDYDTAVALLYQKNLSLKVIYSFAGTYATYYGYNETDAQLFTRNQTALGANAKYFGTWTDPSTTGSSVRYYVYKVYFGEVSPSNTNTPTVALGTEEVGSGALSPKWEGNTTSYPAFYSPSNSTVMSIRWVNASAVSPVNTTTVNVTINGTNYNMPLTAGDSYNGTYQYSIVLGAGGYNWSSSAKENTTLWNTSSVWNFSIPINPNEDTFCIENATGTMCNNQAGTCTGYYMTGGGSGLIGVKQWATYGETVNISMSSSSGLNYIFLNTTNYTQFNNQFVIYPAGYWLAGANTTSNTNYSYNCSQVELEINKANPSSLMSIAFNTSSTVTIGTPVNITCSVPLQINSTSNLYNDTAVITYPSWVFNTTGKSIGTYNFTCNTTGNANYTAGSTNKTLTLTSAAGLSVNVFDEENTTHALTFNITVNNGTASDTAYNQVNPYLNTSISGVITIDITSAGYQQRSYYATIGVVTEINASLLATSSGSWVIFYVYTPTELPIQNALINAERLIPPASWLTVAQKKTDSSGSAAIFLSPTTTYRLNFSAAGYSNQTQQLQPAASPYVIYMLPTSALNISYNTSYKNIILWIEPNGTALYSNESYVFRYYIFSSDNMLQYEGWQLTYSNGTQILLQNTTNAGGVTYTQNIDTAIWNSGYIDFNYWFKKYGFGLVNATQRYYIYGVHAYNTSIMAGVNDIAAGVAAGTPDVTMEQFAFISMLISIICMAAASSQYKLFGSGVIGLMILSMFSFMGTYIWGAAYIVGWELVGLFALGVVATIYIRGGFG